MENTNNTNKKNSINLFSTKGQKNRFFKERLSLKKFFVFNTIFVSTILAVANIFLVGALVYVTMTKKVYMQPPFLLTDTTELDYKQGRLYEETMNNFAEFSLPKIGSLRFFNIRICLLSIRKKS